MSELRRRRLTLPSGHWLSLVEGGDPDAPTVLFIHGAVGASHNFAYQLRHLAARYHVVAPELRGHGSSPWPGPSSLEDFYSDVEAVLDTLPGPVALVGHSFGGSLAAMLASRRPERIRCLALLNTGGHVPRGLLYRVMLWTCWLCDWFSRHYPWMVTTNSTVARELLGRVLPEWNTWDLFPHLHLPVLVLLGRFDLLIPVRFAQRLRELMPWAEVKVLQVGHVVMAEACEAVNAELEALLAREVPAVSASGARPDSAG